MGLMMHQYIDRSTGRVRTERLLADRYGQVHLFGCQGKAPRVFQALTSARGFSLLGYLNFDTFLGTRFQSTEELLRRWGVDVSECLDEPSPWIPPTSCSPAG